MSTNPPAPWRTCEIRSWNPKARPEWYVPAPSRTIARGCALDARKDGSARVTLLQKWTGRRYVTVEMRFARGRRVA